MRRSLLALPVVLLVATAGVPAQAKPVASQFTVAVTATPASVATGASLTIQVHTRIGAVCAATVLYDDGGSAAALRSQHVGPSGIVRWPVLVQTHAAGGTATVACAWQAQVQIGSLRFTVASGPGAAEAAASRSACAPFLAAGRQPKGHHQWGAPPRLVIDQAKHYRVKLYTDLGAITADMLPKLAPITANNFVFLACSGFYDGVIFHRIVPGFVIQGGDPTGTGTGGPGYEFRDEKVPRTYQIGDLAMANSGPNTNGSQFFIVQGPQATSLQRLYSLFGHVTAGMAVVDAIATAPAHMMAGGADTTPSAPNQPVHIQVITVRAM